MLLHKIDVVEAEPSNFFQNWKVSRKKDRSELINETQDGRIQSDK